MQLQLRKLPFKIMDYTSCDPEFPPEDLMAKQSPLATGWQSERFCSYPQTIIIKLFNSQRIFKIQLLLHHYKIATKLELFTSSDNVDYTRLGYVTLGDNSINEFKARELKTIHLDIQTQYIKIDFYKCFVNPLNLYNQVGLVALNVLGSEIVNQMDKVMDDFMTSNAVVRGIIGKSIHNGNLPFNEDLRFLDHDNFILHALTSVSKRKKMAVNDENYILAKNLKSLQEYISQNGVKLTSLESQKRFYIDREEFDQAQSYQNEIQSLKESITKNILMNGFELSKDGLLDLKTNGFYIKSKEIVESQPSVLKNIVNHDNIPVGTNKIPVVSRSATPNDSRPNTAGSRDPTTPNELDALEMQRLALPIKIFGQRPISCLVSPYFGLRQQGINRVNEILIDSGEHSDDDICKATFQVIQLMVTDARERSNAMTCDLYKNLLDFCKSKHVKDSIVVASISETISSFLNKTEDMNPRTREKSMDIVLYMGELYHTTPGTILPFICKPFTNKIQSVPWKHIKARLEIIAQFLTLYGIVDGKNPTQSGWSSTLLIQFIKPFCNHTNPTIRDLSVGLLAQLAVLIGPYALLENVNDIPSNQTELLKAKISAISNTGIIILYH
ncbi:hypothetical protein HDV02_001958 [Globomyces sp. JEL0801]|nr:hypothetical protein HDV02_001958 [Globomyces sp. JEL0801]